MHGPLNSPLAITGVAQSTYRSAGHTGRRLEDLIFDTCAAALKDAGIARDQVDSISIAASDFVDGRCISSMLTANAAGAYLNDEIKTADEGSFALIAAALRLMTGHFQTSLVVAWSKPSESPYAEGQNLASDPFYHRPFGLNHIIASALMANAYRNRYRVPDDAAALVSVKNRTQGCSNPLLDGVSAVELDEVIGSPVVAHPLRKLEIAPEADGACALVLTTADRVRNLDVQPVFLRGLGWCHRLLLPGREGPLAICRTGSGGWTRLSAGRYRQPSPGSGSGRDLRSHGLSRAAGLRGTGVLRARSGRRARAQRFDGQGRKTSGEPFGRLPLGLSRIFGRSGARGRSLPSTAGPRRRPSGRGRANSSGPRLRWIRWTDPFNLYSVQR